MPTYVYRCDSCSHQFDLIQRMADDPITECPACGETVRRVIHPVGVVFKGSGWYINDSRATPSSTNGSTAKKDDADASKPSEQAAKKDGATKAEPATAKTAAD